MPLPSLSVRWPAAVAFFGAAVAVAVVVAAAFTVVAAVVVVGVFLLAPQPATTSPTTAATKPILVSFMGRERSDGPSPATRAPATNHACVLGVGLSGDRVRVHDHRVDHLHDLVGRHPRPLGLLAHLLGARALIDADRPKRPVGLLHDIRANPADV